MLLRAGDRRLAAVAAVVLLSGGARAVSLPKDAARTPKQPPRFNRLSRQTTYMTAKSAAVPGVAANRDKGMELQTVGEGKHKKGKHQSDVASVASQEGERTAESSEAEKANTAAAAAAAAGGDKTVESVLQTSVEGHTQEDKNGSDVTSVASQEGEGSAETSEAKTAHTAAVPAVATGGGKSVLQTSSEDHKEEGKKGSAATSVASQEGEGSAETPEAKKAHTAAVPAVAVGGGESVLQTRREDHKKEGTKGSAATSVASQEGEGSAKTSKAKKAHTAAVPVVAAGGVGSALQTSGGGNTKKERKKESAATTDAAKEQSEDDFSFSNVEAYAENFGKLAKNAQDSIEKAKGQVGDTFKSNQELVNKVKELLGGEDGTGIKMAEKLADMIRTQLKNSTTGSVSGLEDFIKEAIQNATVFDPDEFTKENLIRAERTKSEDKIKREKEQAEKAWKEDHKRKEEQKFEDKINKEGDLSVAGDEDSIYGDGDLSLASETGDQGSTRNVGDNDKDDDHLSYDEESDANSVFTNSGMSYASHQDDDDDDWENLKENTSTRKDDDDDSDKDSKDHHVFDLRNMKGRESDDDSDDDMSGLSIS